MKLTPSHKYIRNTHTCGTILTEYLPNAGRGPQTSERARKSPCNWVGRKKKKESEKGIRTGPGPLGGICERGKVPVPREVPLPVGRLAGTEGELWSLGGERSNWFAAARMERQTVPPPCTPQPKTHVLWYGRGLGVETRASEITPR